MQRTPFRSLFISAVVVLLVFALVCTIALSYTAMDARIGIRRLFSIFSTLLRLCAVSSHNVCALFTLTIAASQSPVSYETFIRRALFISYLLTRSCPRGSLSVSALQLASRQQFVIADVLCPDRVGGASRQTHLHVRFAARKRPLHRLAES
jgi:hypothetical protein